MQINLSTRHGHLSQPTQEKITAKLERLKRFKERMTAVDVTIDLEHENEPKVELRVSVERTNDFVSHTQGESLFGALDGAIHKIEEQIRRHKERLVEHRSAGKRMEAPLPDDDAELDEEA